jgi:hypothetical protein
MASELRKDRISLDYYLQACAQALAFIMHNAPGFPGLPHNKATRLTQKIKTQQNQGYKQQTLKNIIKLINLMFR